MNKVILIGSILICAPFAYAQEDSVRATDTPVPVFRANTEVRPEPPIRQRGVAPTVRPSVTPQTSEAVRPTVQNIQENRKEKLEEARDAFRSTREQFVEERKVLTQDNKEIRTQLQLEASERKTALRAAFKEAQTPEEKQAIREQAQVEQDIFNQKRKELLRDRMADAQNLIQNRAQVLLANLSSAYKKGVQIQERLEQAISDFSAQGVDVSEAQTYVDRAVEFEAQATLDIQEASSEIRIAVETNVVEDARAAFEQAKLAMQSAGQEIKSMYAELRLAHSALKEAVQAFRTTTSDEVE